MRTAAGEAILEARKDAITCGSRVSGLVGRKPIRVRVDATAMSASLT